MSIEYLRSEVEMLKILLRDKKLTTGEELAIQHVVAKIRELNKHLLEKRNDIIKRSRE